ncbi:hypothetical protein SAMN04487846_0926 [Microbacterium sp. cf046]|uniref:hypothetical protein n=1 Tax=Microbacterium sp. cf046 TaxID=1761803 RepID=UPI0008EDF43C|nr:hypothetical protein [Microbacterium sp. cf046]SFR94232.1 hypothetical protein SAMN04487846_0926 [Microbacterium sp. cf046]
MTRRPIARSWAAASVLACVTILAACLPEPGATPSPTASAASATPSASPTPTVAAAKIPTDCREMLDAGVLAELGDIPLNGSSVGASGAQPDGSLICVWGDPAVDTSHLVTTIAFMSRGPALDMLNGLAAEGYSCYRPDGGTRCEKTWFSEPDLLPQGRTLFWREDIMIDSSFSDLAPTGYTAAIVASIFAG